MKCVMLSLLGSVSILAGTKDTGVIGGVSTGEIAKKPVKPQSFEKRDFTIKVSHKQWLGNRSVTINEIEPPRRRPKPVDQPPEQSEVPRIAGSKEEYVEPEFIAVSATIYGKEGHWQTKLTVWHHGKTVSCWSNINGQYLIGFQQWKANGRPYWMLATAVNASNMSEAQKDGCPLEHLRRGGSQPRFIVANNEKDSKALQIISDLHKLYRVEKQKLKLAYGARKQNYELRASLPKRALKPPSSITINFWKRDIEQENKERGTK